MDEATQISTRFVRDPFGVVDSTATQDSGTTTGTNTTRRSGRWRCTGVRHSLRVNPASD
jgi:hypothetical protein